MSDTNTVRDVYYRGPMDIRDPRENRIGLMRFERYLMNSRTYDMLVMPFIPVFRLPNPEKTEEMEKRTALMWMKRLLNRVLIFPETFLTESPFHSIVGTEEFLRRCFRLDINDNEFLVVLLRYLNSKEKQYLNFYIYDNFFANPNLIWASECKVSENKLDYFSYFLHHAKIQRETFGGKWFGQKSYQSLFYCIQIGNVDLLTLLLQNGFSCSIGPRNPECPRRPITFEELCSYNEHIGMWCRQKIPILQALKVIDLTVKYNFGVPKIESEGSIFMFNASINIERVQEALSVLFRAIPIPICRIPTNITERRIEEDGIVNELQYSEQKPCSLKHLSKCAIRKRLGENFQLPEGIGKLGLPRYLEGYVNLEFD